MITGILSISNAAVLEYPYPVVVHNLLGLCDNVIVGVDPKFPLDKEVLHSFNVVGSKLSIIDAPWDLSNREGGSEIAIQMDSLVSLAERQGSDWVVVMQADEMFHDDDFDMLRAFMERSSDVTGFKTNRLYFWKDLNTIRSDWNASLVRIFRPGTYSFMAEGTDKAGMYSAPISPGREVKLPYHIYHYSRVDSPETISYRIRNLDSFFHPEIMLIPEDSLPPYDFVTREHDNYAISGMPKVVEGSISDFLGSHPDGVKEWYLG